ncbi:MAG: helix-turn-helix transcriptional regulator [Clostridium sp.]|nr:helix-turn-helix transcriptional regulator [Clostridium sp.]
MGFAQKFDMIMKERNITNYEMSKKTGISDSLIGYWRKGERIPKADNLLNISDFLDISIDYLLGKTDEPHVVSGNSIKISNIHGDNNANNVSINSEILDKETLELVNIIKQLSLVERSKVIMFIEEMKGK